MVLGVNKNKVPLALLLNELFKGFTNISIISIISNQIIMHRHCLMHKQMR